MSEPNHEFQREELGVLQEMVEAVRETAPSEAQWQNAQMNLKALIESNRKESWIMKLQKSSKFMQYRWATAALFVVIIFVVMIGVNFWDRGHGQAFAAIVEQIRKAQTLTFTMIQYMESQPPRKIQMAYKDPGLMRQTAELGIVSIVDMTQKRGISINPLQQQYIDMDLSTIPTNNAQFNMVEGMKKLPAIANEVLGASEMNGRIVQGFRVLQAGLRQDIWIDIESGNLVRIESDFINAPGNHVVMTDFVFNPELEDSFFSLTPPEGYKRIAYQADASQPGEEHLISLLEYWGTHTKEKIFPKTLNPASLTTQAMELQKTGGFVDDSKEPLTAEQRTQKMLQDATKMTHGLMFILQMKPENDWQYTGDGVHYGEKEKAIFWYKPTGSQTYRVIYGDLSVKDVSANELPTEKK